VIGETSKCALFSARCELLGRQWVLRFIRTVDVSYHGHYVAWAQLVSLVYS